MVKIIIRIVALPFYAGMLGIYLAFTLLRNCVLFVRYGGELLTHAKDDKKMIADIYQELKKQHGTK